MTSSKIRFVLVAFLVPALLSGQSTNKRKDTGHRTNHAPRAQYFGINYEDVKWQPIVPELGEDSPQIAILRVDPRTHATQLLIRTSKQMHVPLHWHSGNETHTVIRGEGTFAHGDVREQFGPGSFNYIPARMKHEAWVGDDSLVFITVDSAWDIHWVNGPPTKADLGKMP
jgi:mannose-6-phosphate isomerase-like protein (cupin superfamily)